MKSTLIVPITLLATLAAGVLVHDRLRTKPLLKPPKLVNPPSDPAQKPQAKSVLQPGLQAPEHRDSPSQSFRFASEPRPR